MGYRSCRKGAARVTESGGRVLPVGWVGRAILGMSNTAARWTLVAALATTTLLTATVTGRLAAGSETSPHGTTVSRVSGR